MGIIEDEESIERERVALRYTVNQIIEDILLYLLHETEKEERAGKIRHAAWQYRYVLKFYPENVRARMGWLRTSRKLEKPLFPFK